MYTFTAPNAIGKGKLRAKQMGANDVFLKYFITLIIDAFELTPETGLNDLHCY